MWRAKAYRVVPNDRDVSTRAGAIAPLLQVQRHGGWHPRPPRCTSPHETSTAPLILARCLSFARLTGREVASSLLVAVSPSLGKIQQSLNAWIGV